MNKRILALLEDTVMFACYVTLLYLAIFAYRNHLSTKNYNQMKSLLSGEQIRTDGYDSITSIDEYYVNCCIALHIQIPASTSTSTVL